MPDHPGCSDQGRVQSSVGTVEKSKFGDLIAVSGDPLRTSPRYNGASL